MISHCSPIGRTLPLSNRGGHKRKFAGCTGNDRIGLAKWTLQRAGERDSYRGGASRRTDEAGAVVPMATRPTAEKPTKANTELRS
jgi:hypothetical protein